MNHIWITIGPINSRVRQYDSKEEATEESIRLAKENGVTGFRLWRLGFPGPVYFGYLAKNQGEDYDPKLCWWPDKEGGC